MYISCVYIVFFTHHVIALQGLCGFKLEHSEHLQENMVHYGNDGYDICIYRFIFIYMMKYMYEIYIYIMKYIHITYTSMVSINSCMQCLEAFNIPV